MTIEPVTEKELASLARALGPLQSAVLELHNVDLSKAELSVDHITAWMGQGTSSSMARSMKEEIMKNMTAALKEAK